MLQNLIKQPNSSTSLSVMESYFYNYLKPYQQLMLIIHFEKILIKSCFCNQLKMIMMYIPFIINLFE